MDKVSGSFFQSSAKIFIEAYALYVLSGSLLLNFILLRSVVVQRYKFALEKNAQKKGKVARATSPIIRVHLLHLLCLG